MPLAAFDVEFVRRLVSAQFPQWAVLPVRAVQPGGWDNASFRLGERMVVRLPRSAAYAAQVEKEHSFLPALRPFLPLEIPVPLVLGEAVHGYPWKWSIYQCPRRALCRNLRQSKLVSLVRALHPLLLSDLRHPRIRPRRQAPTAKSRQSACVRHARHTRQSGVRAPLTTSWWGNRVSWYTVFSTVVGLPLYVLKGQFVLSGYSEVFGQLSLLLGGAVIACAYWSPLRERFERNDG